MSIDRTFIIGLPDEFRGAALEAELECAGMSSRRSDGIRIQPDRMHQRDDVDHAAAAVLLRRRMGAAEVGCALAHQRVYERILDEGLEYAIVFEDDARLRRPLDHDAIVDLLAVAHPRVVALYAPRGFAIVDETRASVGGGGRVVAYPAIVPPTTTTAYALNRAAADVLLRRGRPISHVADWPVWAEVHCEFLVLAEPVAAPDDLADSQIDRPEARASRSARLAGRLRRILHLDWARHRRLYGDYRTYVMHELVRQPAYAWAGHRNAQDGSIEPAPPIAAPPMMRWAARVVAGPVPFRSDRLRPE